MQKTLFVLTAILALAFSRLIPHAPNFTPLLAMALWLGSQGLSRKSSAVILISSLLISDWMIGFHNLIPVVYGTLLAILLGGELLKNCTQFNQSNFLSNSGAWILGGVLSSVFFFATTNLAVWWTSGMYPLTTAGLTECFVLALPFFHNTLLSTLLFSGLLLCATHVLRRTQDSRTLKLSK